MHRLFCSSFLLLSLNAIASPNYLGAADCRIVDTSATAGATATWEGPCKDGYAEGNGSLLWFKDGKPQDIYEGQLVRGVPNGQGHLFTAAKVHYIGGFSDGKLKGAGTRVDSEGRKLVGNFDAGHPVGIVDYRSKEDNRYHGGWDAEQDAPSGQGTMDYALGGRYEGQWQGGAGVGTGTVTYPNGIIRQASLGPGHDSKANKADVKFSVLGDMRSHDMLSTVAKDFVVPPALSYNSMSKEQQAIIKRSYPILQDDDTPPYLSRGQKELMREFAEATRLSADKGRLSLNVLIDADGKPSSVSVLETPSANMTQYAAALLIRQKYTPAICAGQPCAMSFPFRVLRHPDN